MQKKKMGMNMLGESLCMRLHYLHTLSNVIFQYLHVVLWFIILHYFHCHPRNFDHLCIFCKHDYYYCTPRWPILRRATCLRQGILRVSESGDLPPARGNRFFPIYAYNVIICIDCGPKRKLSPRTLHIV